MQADLPKNKIIILFDGVCNFCNSSVQFIIKHDQKDRFRFVPIQSKIGKEIIHDLGIDITKIDSIIVYEPGNTPYLKSAAALKIAMELGSIFKIAALTSIVPVTIRDFFYDFLARNRYKWFGQKADCMIPGPELRSKFL
ncbi:MAG: DUF393 domain-containing protein [Bacteroidetes bacterium]|nr:DUF393 domain-containing protein [Bacteroidota bacterium]